MKLLHKQTICGENQRDNFFFYTPSHFFFWVFAFFSYSVSLFFVFVSVCLFYEKQKKKGKEKKRKEKKRKEKKRKKERKKKKNLSPKKFYPNYQFSAFTFVQNNDKLSSELFNFYWNTSKNFYYEKIIKMQIQESIRYYANDSIRASLMLQAFI